MRVRSVIFQTIHLGALEHLHAMLDQQILDALETQKRIYAIGAAVSDSSRVFRRAQNAFQLSLVVSALIGESNAFSTFALGCDGFLT